MSRGLGRVERWVVDELAGAWADSGVTTTTLRTLAARERISEPSLRRAIGTLTRKKLIVRDPNGRRPIAWMLPEELRRRRRREQAHERERRKQERMIEEARIRRAGVSDDPAMETLARALGMLGSAHDGEVVAAARKVQALQRKTGHTWQQLLGLE